MKVNEIIVEGPWDAVKAFGKGLMGGAAQGAPGASATAPGPTNGVADLAHDAKGAKILSNRANEIFKGWASYVPQARLNPAKADEYKDQLDNYIKLWLKQPKVLMPNAQLQMTKAGVIEYISASLANYMRTQTPNAQLPQQPANPVVKTGKAGPEQSTTTPRQVPGNASTMALEPKANPLTPQVVQSDPARIRYSNADYVMGNKGEWVNAKNGRPVPEAMQQTFHDVIDQYQGIK
jgi:hypothetical protein